LFRLPQKAGKNRQSTSRAGAFICALDVCVWGGFFNMDAARVDLWGDDCALKTNHRRAI
jgi:hypothetical protein